MNYNAIQKFFNEDSEFRQLCAEMLQVNTSIFREIVENQKGEGIAENIKFTVNGKCTRDQLHLMYDGMSSYSETNDSDLEQDIVSKTSHIRNLYEECATQCKSSEIQTEMHAKIDGMDYKTSNVSSVHRELKLTDTLTVNVVDIRQHLSYHLMCHDASAKLSHLTLDEDVATIILSGGCYGPHVVLSKILPDQIIKSRLKLMATRLCRLIQESNEVIVKWLFKSKKSLLYHDRTDRVAKLMNDLKLKEEIKTFLCESIWPCAVNDKAWKRAVEFLKKYVNDWPVW